MVIPLKNSCRHCRKINIGGWLDSPVFACELRQKRAGSANLSQLPTRKIW